MFASANDQFAHTCYAVINRTNGYLQTQDRCSGPRLHEATNISYHDGLLVRRNGDRIDSMIELCRVDVEAFEDDVGDDDTEDMTLLCLRRSGGLMLAACDVVPGSLV